MRSETSTSFKKVYTLQWTYSQSLDLKKVAESRQKLLEQQNETMLVKKVSFYSLHFVRFEQETDLLESGAKVYKLIGAALLKQDLNEVKANVAKRLDFINGEL